MKKIDRATIIVLDSLGDYHKAVNYYERALKIQAAHFGEDHIETASTLMNLGVVFMI